MAVTFPSMTLNDNGTKHLVDSREVIQLRANKLNIIVCVLRSGPDLTSALVLLTLNYDNNFIMSHDSLCPFSISRSPVRLPSLSLYSSLPTIPPYSALNAAMLDKIYINYNKEAQGYRQFERYWRT